MDCPLVAAQRNLGSSVWGGCRQTHIAAGRLVQRAGITCPQYRHKGGVSGEALPRSGRGRGRRNVPASSGTMPAGTWPVSPSCNFAPARRPEWGYWPMIINLYPFPAYYPSPINPPVIFGSVEAVRARIAQAARLCRALRPRYNSPSVPRFVGNAENIGVILETLLPVTALRARFTWTITRRTVQL